MEWETKADKFIHPEEKQVEWQKAARDSGGEWGGEAESDCSRDIGRRRKEKKGVDRLCLFLELMSQQPKQPRKNKNQKIIWPFLSCSLSTQSIYLLSYISSQFALTVGTEKKYVESEFYKA